MKVLMVIDSKFPSMGGGGAESQIITIGNALQREGHVVKVMGPMAEEGPQILENEVEGLHTTRIPYPKIKLLGTIILHLRAVWWLLRNLDQYDVVHAHIAHYFIATVVMAAKLKGKPIYVKITGYHELSEGFLVRGPASVGVKVMRWIYHRVNGFHAISQEIASRLEETGYPKDKIYLLPNAVDDRRFNPSSRGLKQPPLPVAIEGRRVMIFVGRLVPEKALPVLLEAWSRSQDQRPEALLLLVGQGRQTNEIKDLAAKLELTDTVLFLGPRGDIPDLLSISDMMVLPSYEEGLSNTLLESMAAGLPCLVTRISGNEDFIEHEKNGWLVPPGSVEALTDALITAFNSDESTLRRYGDHARETILKRCGVDYVKTRLLSMYVSNDQGPQT